MLHGGHISDTRNPNKGVCNSFYKDKSNRRRTKDNRRHGPRDRTQEAYQAQVEAVVTLEKQLAENSMRTPLTGTSRCLHTHGSSSSDNYTDPAERIAGTTLTQEEDVDPARPFLTNSCE
jgi:hypothetical protein